ncbi:MAG: SDR family NAD(P)-dependent oxidoreductase, partial [Gammaproteobacteria bacterium]|nr:SDR family NAD(P)-dependent oxidoreductase [Gammaproteobacteria bacterium]
QLLNLLPEKTTDYCLAVTDEHELIKAKNHVENHLSIKTMQFNLNSAFVEQFSADQRFDLVIIRHCLHESENSEKTLRELNKVLTANSIVLIEESYVDRMQAFVSAVTTPDLQKKHFTPRYCQQLLTQSGFSVAEPLYEPDAGELEGAFVMMAQSLQVPELLINNGEFQWLILTDNTEIVAPLVDELKKNQTKVFIATGENTLDSIQKLLAQFTENQDKLRIVQLMGINAGSQDVSKNPLFSVENHCGVLIHLIKAIQNLGWSVYPQLTIVAQGGALCDSDNMVTLTKNPEHAALWGFGRVLMNEHPELQCRLIDLQSKTLIKLSKHFVDELLNPHTENEIIITESACYGLRVAEINATPLLKNNQNNFRLDFSRPGPLKNLQWFPLEKSKLADDEVAVKPHASGLNFRDVMYSMGLIPDEAVEDGFLGQTLGMEFAGEVVAVGNKVTDFSKGDKVMGFAPASFSSYAITKAYAVTPLPSTWNYSAGASIPIAFFTAFYALMHLARIEPGERLLIHGAAGGVGIAAIQLAQHLGVEIYATAGSDEKRDFLALLGIKHIYNSRDLAFADQVMEQTKNEGIDVVLNCLAGEAINSNLSIMKPFGRFLELGKRDFYANSKIGLRPFRNNVSYFGIDADQLIVKNPALSNKLFKEMFSLFDQGILSPLPYREFSAENIHDAFRYMQQSRHIGKIIVNFSAPPTSNFALVENNKTLTLNSNATYLVTGGLNGFGFRTAEWLAEKGAKHLVLLGRSGVNCETIKSAIAALNDQGVSVHAKALDITDSEVLNNLLLEIKNEMPPLKGIFHAAAVYEDTIITNLTDEKMHNVLAPKLLGAWNLHQAAITHQLSLDYFVVYSSVTTLLGNPGQANYVAANAFLENLVSMRRTMHLPGFYVAWGAIDDVGYLARNSDVKHILTSKMGMPVLTSTQALASLEQLLLEQHNHTGAIISDLNGKTLKRFAGAGSAKFELLCSNNDDNDAHDDERQMDIRQKIADGSLTENDVVEMLKHEIGKILYIAPEKINIDESLLNMGMDSLMGVELANAIEQSFGVSIPILALSQDPTINKLAKRLVTQLCKGETAEPINQDKEVQAILKISAQHGEVMTEEQVVALLNKQSIEV